MQSAAIDRKIFSPDYGLPPDSLTAVEQPAGAGGRVGIVIVSFNSAVDLERCLASIGKFTYPDFEVIIVENGNLKVSGAELAALSGCFNFRIRIILNPENNGFAGGSNIGIKSAVDYGADLIWLLNPDTECRPEALSGLVEAASTYPDGAAFGSKIYYGGSENLIWSAGGIVDCENGVMSMRGNQDTDHGQFETADRCGYLPGCSMLLRRSALEQIGYLPESYFLYFEETDWCLQARQAGLQLYYVPQSVIIHHSSDQKLQRPLVVFYYNRNQRRFRMKFGAKPVRKRIVKDLILQTLPSALRGYFGAADAGMRAVFRAHLLALLDFFLPGAGEKLLWRHLPK